MNKRAAFTLLMLLLSSTIALADDVPLLGTWKLKSMVREVAATGEKFNQMGEHPSGYISYSADGRMYAIGISENRIKPRDADAADEDRVKLHRTMFAYAGTYTVEDGKVTHHVDVSWNETWTGTDVVRFYQLEGNILTITTPPFKSSFGGPEARSILVWERVQGPTQ